MRNFLRTLKHSWPYRYRLAASVFCALAVAALWSLNLSAIYPVLMILSTDKNLQQWVDGEITDLEQKLQKLRGRLDEEKEALRQIQQSPPSPERDERERKVAWEIAKLEREMAELGARQYQYRLLEKWAIRRLPADRFATFVWIITAVIAGVAVKGVFEFLQESLVGGVMNRTLFDLRNRFFRRAIHQDVRQLAATGTHELMARFTNDMEQLGLGIRILYGRMVAEPLKMVGCLLVACYISWQLTLVFVLLVPAAVVTLMRVSKMMRRAARRLLERMSAIYKIVREAFDAARVVKAFTREPHERRRFRRATREYYRKAMRVVNIDAFANPMIELLGVAAVSLALAAGTYLVVTGNTQILGFPMTSQPMSFATLLQLYAFLAAVADPVRKLSSVYTKLQTGGAAANRIFELFDRMPTVGANAAGPRITAVEKGVEFRNVCFSYNPAAEPTLDRINLVVKAGETVAIVGPNGCGKTTLLGLLPRFYDPDFGAVLIDGVNVRTAHLRTLRARIGIVTQDPQLFDDTVFANIAYGKKGATREEVAAAAKKARAHDFIERKPDGYDTRMGDAGVNFSGGEKQKIALARAILRDPDILILDEFTSQADTKSEADIHAALKEFVRGRTGPEPDEGATGAAPAAPAPARKVRTTFLITHRLHTLEIADRIVVMDAGRIVAVGTHHELIASCEVYQRLHQSAQFRTAA